MAQQLSSSLSGDVKFIALPPLRIDRIDFKDSINLSDFFGEGLQLKQYEH